MKNQGLKIAFGIIIFLFSVALAYFTAWYFQDNERKAVNTPSIYEYDAYQNIDNRSDINSRYYGVSGGFDVFWIVLLIFGGAYILIGIFVARIFPISLGFLFAADVTILHALNDQYRGLDSGVKALIVTVLLVGLYSFAAIKLKDRSLAPIKQVIPTQ